MATEDRPAAYDLTWLERLAGDPGSFDFHAALRRFEGLNPDKPRLGEAARPSDEPLRVSQAPSAVFEPTALAGFVAPRDGAPAQVIESFLGLWGPHGPLPGHLTEYARERLRHAGDATLTKFLDLFHHRMLIIFHRAWAKAQPTVALDRPDDDNFARYVGSLMGVGLPALQGRDRFPDRAKLFYAGRFAACARNAEGLREVVADHFGVQAAVEEFVGEWMDLPYDGRWKLGASPDTGSLGRNTVLGARVWSRSHKFRIVLGPLSNDDFRRTMPSSETFGSLAALVRLYTNDEWDWDVRLVLAPEATQPMHLGQGARLGWTTRIGSGGGEREDLLVDPTLRRTRRVTTSTPPCFTSFTSFTSLTK